MLQKNQIPLVIASVYVKESVAMYDYFIPYLFIRNKILFF